MLIWMLRLARCCLDTMLYTAFRTTMYQHGTAEVAKLKSHCADLDAQTRQVLS